MPDLRLYYAAEVEEALVSLLWHHPELIAEALRVIEPATHLSQPKCRHLLEAITLCYRQAGATDWATSLECLAELGHLQECGGLLELDRLYSRPGHLVLFSHYLALLADYAAHRGTQSQPQFYSGGRALLVPNKAKTKESQPDFIGRGRLAGRFYALSAWKKDSLPELQIHFKPMLHG